MITVILTFPVQNKDFWLTQFEARKASRFEAGCRDVRAYCSSDDASSTANVIFDWVHDGTALTSYLDHESTGQIDMGHGGSGTYVKQVLGEVRATELHESYVENWIRRLQSEPHTGAVGRLFSRLWQWLVGGKGRHRGWQGIADEVGLRKRLILAAAQDLSERIQSMRKGYEPYFEFHQMRGEQTPSDPDDSRDHPRRRAYNAGVDAQHAYQKREPNVMVMAAADVFVEKAQKKLTHRGNIYLFLGAFAAGVAIFALIWFANRLLEHDFTQNYRQRDDTTLQGYQLVPPWAENRQLALDAYTLPLIILKNLTVGAFALGAVYFLVMISRACLHEAAVLFSRRHALRFGRLYVYATGGHIDYRDMERAFAWNHDFVSAFQDIRGDKVSKGVVHTVTDVLKEVSKNLATVSENVAAASGAKKSDSGRSA